ncbi:hypothetical protein NL676_022424 [Syzygium grande]|nr:hypothetical protein NL676_022424 [Syzygium grande]
MLAGWTRRGMLLKNTLVALSAVLDLFDLSMAAGRSGLVGAVTKRESAAVDNKRSYGKGGSSTGGDSSMARRRGEARDSGQSAWHGHSVTETGTKGSSAKGANDRGLGQACGCGWPGVGGTVGHTREQLSFSLSLFLLCS